MAPCVAGKFPALCLHCLCHFRGIFYLFLIIKIRMVFQKTLLIILQILLCLICNICAVSQYPVITGHCQNTFSSMIRKIRMLFHKAVNDWNQIIISPGNTSVIFHIFCLHITVLVQNQPICKSITVHIVIITYIIL